jgi:dihydroorotase
MKTLIKGASVVNEGSVEVLDVLIENDLISRIEKPGVLEAGDYTESIDASGLHLFPGLIDDQVHFREPGLTHKADIRTESRAAAAGGITSFMEMPNTVPNTLTQELLQDKYDIAAESSLVNYSFFMGASNDNIEEVLKTDPKNVCGVKVFMGSSTGNMLVDQKTALEGIFSQSPTLVATHCEDEATIRANTAIYREKYGEDVPISSHPLIRSAEACYKSSSFAAELAAKHNTRLHILHISTAKECGIFRNDIPLAEKRITAEACVHHLWFSSDQYDSLGTRIKWNPAVKTAQDRDGILVAVLDNRIDVIATDHAPHTLEEKSNTYFNAPSGGPLVQHVLIALLDLYHQGKITLTDIARKTSHAVAECFEIGDRGYVREGFKADLVLVDLNAPTEVNSGNILYKCGWSPFEGHSFSSSISQTFVNGSCVYKEGKIIEGQVAERLTFDR